MSIEKIYLKGINPTLPTVYDDGLSYIEAIAKLQYKINECIDLLVKIDVEGFYAKLEESVAYINSVAQNVNTELAKQLDSVNASLEQALALNRELIEQNNDYVRALISNTLNEIENIVAEKSLEVKATNPLTGKLDDLNKSLGITDSICRNNALNCFARDGIGVTCDDFDSFGDDFEFNCYLLDVYTELCYLEFLGSFIYKNPQMSFNFNVHPTKYGFNVSFGSIGGYDPSIINSGDDTPIFLVGTKLSNLLHSVPQDKPIGTFFITTKSIRPSSYSDAYPIYFKNGRVYLSKQYTADYANSIYGSDLDNGGMFTLNIIELNQLYSYV